MYRLYNEYGVYAEHDTAEVRDVTYLKCSAHQTITTIAPPQNSFSCTQDFSVCAKQNDVLTYLSQAEEAKHTCEQWN